MSGRPSACSVSTEVQRTYPALLEGLAGGFLLPRGFPGHEHRWVHLDSGFCVCGLCGEEHVCFRGKCPVEQVESSERVCTLTGCVVEGGEMRAEWGAMDRGAVAGAVATTGPVSGRHVCGMELSEFVEMVVRDILDSPKTAACEQEERQRDDSRRAGGLARLLREAVHSGPRGRGGEPVRPNMVTIEGRLAWMCRKTRDLGRRGCVNNNVQRIIAVCAESICKLLQTHGWHRVGRQLQHATRGREFVCSMLYLMRMGITFQNRCLLQRIDALHDLLPLQVFLPTAFGIRAKSITEGENIIKLDIRRMPL